MPSSLSKLKLSAGALLFDLCMAVPLKLLGGLAGDDVWAVGALAEAQGDGACDGGVDVDENLLPQQLITQVSSYAVLAQY